MQYFTHIYSNGLRLIHLPSDSPVCYCGFAVQAGSRDENPEEAGLAHFVEHMLFKGTVKRNSMHILNRMENVGGELNAYTTKEDTFIYSIFMEEHVSRALELLSDIVFHSQFPSLEVEKEIEVILDEINVYKDTPSELIFDEFENLLFAGHPLGHHILGEEETLTSFTSVTGRSFTERFYHPANMVFFSMGHIPFQRMVRLVEKFIDFSSGTFLPAKRWAPSEILPVKKRQEMDTHQAHVLLGGRSYNMFDEKRTALFLLNNLLGGPGMNSRLNIALREKHGLVYQVDSSVTSYTDTGFVGIYFGTDHKNLEKATDLVQKELKKVRNNGLSLTQLAAVKKQIKGQLGVAGDNKESLFLGLGKNFLHYNRYDMLAEIFQKIDKVTTHQISEVANEIFDPEKMFTLIYE